MAREKNLSHKWLGKKSSPKARPRESIHEIRAAGRERKGEKRSGPRGFFLFPENRMRFSGDPGDQAPYDSRVLLVPSGHRSEIGARKEPLFPPIFLFGACRRKSQAIFDGRRGSFFPIFPPTPGPLRFQRNLRGPGVGENIGRGKSIEIGGKPVFFTCFTRSFRAPISDRCPEGTVVSSDFDTFSSSEGRRKNSPFFFQKKGPEIGGKPVFFTCFSHVFFTEPYMARQKNLPHKWGGKNNSPINGSAKTTRVSSTYNF